MNSHEGTLTHELFFARAFMHMHSSTRSDTTARTHDVCRYSLSLYSYLQICYSYLCRHCIIKYGHDEVLPRLRNIKIRNKKKKKKIGMNRSWIRILFFGFALFYDANLPGGLLESINLFCLSLSALQTYLLVTLL